MITVELKTAKDLKAVVEAAFPKYRKKKVFVSAFNGGVNINSYWDGGSRSEFAVVNLETLRRASLPTCTHPYFDVAARGLTQAQDGIVRVDHVGNITLETLPEGFVLVEAGTFCGKPATAHVFVPPANLPKFLTEGRS